MILCLTFSRKRPCRNPFVILSDLPFGLDVLAVRRAVQAGGRVVCARKTSRQAAQPSAGLDLNQPG